MSYKPPVKEYVINASVIREQQLDGLFKIRAYCKKQAEELFRQYLDRADWFKLANCLHDSSFEDHHWLENVLDVCENTDDDYDYEFKEEPPVYPLIDMLDEVPEKELEMLQKQIKLDL